MPRLRAGGLGPRSSVGHLPAVAGSAGGGHGPNQLSRAPSSVTTEPESAAPSGEQQSATSQACSASRPEALERDGAGRGAPDRLGVLAQRGGVEVAGRDRDHGDPVRRPLVARARACSPRRRRARRSSASCPARPWCGESVTLTTVPPPAGRNASSAASRRHPLGRADVEPRDGAPALRLDRLGGREVLAAGVVDERVEAAAALEREADDPLGVGRLADVAGDVPRGRAPPRSPRAPPRAGRRSRRRRRTRRSSAAAARPSPVPPPVTSTARPASSAVGEDLGAVHAARVYGAREEATPFAGTTAPCRSRCPHRDAAQPDSIHVRADREGVHARGAAEPREARAGRAAAQR